MTILQSIQQIPRRWLTGCLLFFVLSCGRREGVSAPAFPIPSPLSPLILQEALDSIRSGDMVTRTGNDFTSLCLRQLCQTDRTYSHCGIASREHDSVFVYHALGGDFNPDQRLLREPLAEFIAPAANRGFGLFRFAMSGRQEARLIEETVAAYRQGIPFDMNFDLATDDKMYCSEFTAKMYRRAYNNDSLFAVSCIRDFRFIAPDNLFTDPLCRRLLEKVY